MDSAVYQARTVGGLLLLLLLQNRLDLSSDALEHVLRALSRLPTNRLGMFRHPTRVAAEDQTELLFVESVPMPG